MVINGINLEEVNQELIRINKDEKIKIDNPFIISLKDFTQKFVYIDGYKDRVIELVCITNKMKNDIEQDLRNLKAQRDRKFDALVITAEVSNLKNQQQRDSSVKNKLVEDDAVINKITDTFFQVKTFYENVRLVLDHLSDKKETNSRMLTGLKYGILVGEIAIKQGDLNNQDILIKMQQTGGMND